MTSDGFIPMGSIKPGMNVIGADGKPHIVTHIFPQGVKDVYKITFTDKTTTECCKEHLWTILPKNNYKYKKTIHLQELFDKPLIKVKQGKYKEHLYYIPVTKPIEFEKKELLIDPYILGVILGDGCIRRNSCSLTSADKELIDYISNKLDKTFDNIKISPLPSCKYGYIFSQKVKKFTVGPKGNPVAEPNPFVEALHDLNLIKSSADKFIPNIYLHSSVEDRIELLQGLMDTDGTITKNGSTIQFNTISSQLCDNFIYLVQSLGGVAQYKEVTGKYKKDGKVIECNTSYTISIKLPKEIKPFKLSRKLSRINPNSLNPSRAIESIELSRKVECQCIMINSDDHLYLTDNCIVTHNSEIAVAVACYLMYRIMCLKNPIEFFHLKPTEKICFAFMNIKLALAEEIGISKFQNTVKLSPWFMARGTMEGRTNLKWVPPDYINIIIGSQADDLIGLPIFFAFFDEISFMRNQDIDKQKEKAINMIDTAIGGMKTRFIYKGINPTLLALASSKRSEKSFLEEHIKKKLKSEK